METVPLGALDWALFFVVFLGSCAAAFSGKKLVQARQLTLPVMVATLVATWYGDVFGVTQIAFEQGVYMFLTQGVCWYVAYIAFALFLAKRLHRSAALSLCDLVRKRHGPQAALLTASLTLLIALPLSCAAGGGVLLTLLTGWPLPLTMTFVVAVSAAVAHYGGFGAVVRSDVIQCFLMCGAVALVALFSIAKLGLHLPDYSGAGPAWKGMTVWFVLAASMTFLNPALCQRCLAAKDERIAQRGVLLACLVWMLFDCCTLLGGLYARALFPNMDSIYAYFHFGLYILPSGLRGLFVAGLLAAILSTLDSFLLVSIELLHEELRLPRRLATLIAITATVALPFCFDLAAESMWICLHGVFASALLIPMLLARTQAQFLVCAFCGAAGTLSAFVVGIGIWAPIVGLSCNLGALWTTRMFSSSPTAIPSER